MRELDKKAIHTILEELETTQKRQIHSEKIRTSTTIDGCRTARELSDIIDEAVIRVLQEMEIPEEVTIIGVWATGRQEATPWSDLDVIWYVPNSEEYEKKFAEPYRKNMWRLLNALDLKGEPTVWVPGDFMKSDLVTIASMNLDARKLHGGNILTIEDIQQKVRAICEPFFIASRHEEILQNFRYWNDGKNEFKVDFDIKEDRGWLRHLQHILWLLAAIQGIWLQNMYTEIQRKDPEVYQALDLMLHIRSWLHLKKLWTKDRKIDLLSWNMWPELKEQFWNDIIERIQTARRAIIRYERTRILWEKKKGIKVGDGTKWWLLGLEIDNKSWLPKEDLVIQLLINAQKTGLKISPLVFSYLETEARKYMTHGNEKYSQIVSETGNFGETVRRMRSMGIIDNLFPWFSLLENQTYSPKHRHADINQVGRIMVKLENLGIHAEKSLKDIYATLSHQQQAGIRIALVCNEIPTIAEVSRRDYFKNLKDIHPTLWEGIDIAEYLVEKNLMLFDCSHMDDWIDERELKRIAREIESLDRLNALLIYTCAELDYDKTEYFHKSLWDKTFALYYALEKEIKWSSPEEEQEKLILRKWRLSPEQNTILDTSQETFLRSRYISSSDALGKTMMYLEKAQETRDPQIKVTRNQEGGLRIIVSSLYSNEISAIIAGTCFQNSITINDAEIHTFNTQSPLAVFFLEAGFSTPNLTPSGQDAAIQKFQSTLQENLQRKKVPQIDAYDILGKWKPTFLLEETHATNRFKLIVTAEDDVPWFLFAMTKIISETWTDILSTNIYTYPRHNGDSPYIEDTFILSSKNITILKEKLQIQ